MNENVKIFNMSELVGKFVYLTESGDTVLSIAKKFHASPNAIIKLNGLCEEPKAGRILIIEKAKGFFHIVKPEESMESICGYDRMKVNSLKIKNRTDFIYVGMRIIV